VRGGICPFGSFLKTFRGQTPVYFPDVCEGIGKPSEKEEENLSETAKKMDLRYITINGLDPTVEKKMMEDLKRTGYSGTKSAYVTQLCSEALDARSRKSELTSKEDAESMVRKLDEALAKLDYLSSEFVREKAENPVYKQLLCETFNAVGMLLSLQSGDPDAMSYFEKGWYDGLPTHLSRKLSEVRRSYANA
jgi:hypothetical protein